MRLEFDSPDGLDPERLGQLGDFFGGLLNPVFGFLTVALLIYTSTLQRREFNNSEKALQSTANEARRKQAEDAIAALFVEQESIFRRELYAPFCDGEGYSTRTLYEAHIKDMAREHRLLANYIQSDAEQAGFPRDLNQVVLQLAANIRMAAKLTAEIIKLSESEVAQGFWLHKFIIQSAKYSRCGVIGHAEHQALHSEILNSLSEDQQGKIFNVCIEPNL